MSFVRLLLAIAALLAFTPAHADIWAYVDERGVTHFASEKLDARYQVFFRSGQSFDTSRDLKSARAVAVPTAPPKLIAYFEVAPSFLAVKHHLREAATQHGIDYELLQALIATESGFDVDAVSPKGAVGLMQLMPATAQRYGVSGDANQPIQKKLTDPRTNIRAGTRYLQDLIRMFPGQLELALAAYNAGEGAVQRAGNRIPNYPETQNYVKTVMQLYGVLKPPATRQPQPVGRVRMEIPAGGALGRGNLPAQGPVSLPTLREPATPLAAGQGVPESD
jgi:soluble lytic murein transglycosylase-like protein